MFLGVIGLLELTSYVGDHHVSSSAWLWVLASLAVGAVGLGALRGLSMRVWTTNGWVVRQGNAVTMALWLVSLVVQFRGRQRQQPCGRDEPRSGELLLYLGLTLGVQYYVVFRRAVPLWEQLGPNVGRPMTA